MNIEIICSGFGGQGVLTTGMLMAYAFHRSGKNITWYPSYGSEMRGGTANCMVKASDSEIASPYVKNIDILVTLNEPAITKFEGQIKYGGHLFVNASLVPDDREYREDINVTKVDTEALAAEVNNPKGANIAMIGAMLKKTHILSFDAYNDAMTKYFSDKGKSAFTAKNTAALKAGYDFV